MIHQISTTNEEARAALASVTGGTPAKTPSPASASSNFRALHAQALARTKEAGDTAINASSERIDVPEGETWAAAKPGAHYARIVSGPRAGQYINLTHGERRGQTFTIENREGRDVHVYTASGVEVVIKPSVDARDVSDAARRAGHRPSDQPRAGEQWAPVEGHNNYADILGGKRNGLYVNISGGIRDGMAFQIVKKGDKVFHVYGTGKDKQMIQVAPKDKPDKADEASGTKGADDKDVKDTKDTTGAASGTGGVAAPTQ